MTMNKTIELKDIEIDNGAYILDAGVDVYHDEVNDRVWAEDFTVEDITYIHIRSATRILEGTVKGVYPLSLEYIPESILNHFKEQVVAYLEYTGVTI